ncbi:hypothetical protein PSU4_07050 [Pseudonocardia sulfidoxydans NBRC 16205]|uniref:CoA transferase n=1 Tax=Pseudonocardia sulfidoxydans NBRC 16205 TaxID=1223511 RepID=A0A511DAE8_9PSEU|nr:CoA transferase [Pseudonocardia sulfidoxydans]GEL21751.1 hypothetical protein PSU4_07050 [Pseudonocardia sulfidoxydans NBRC 16205]
MTAFWAGPSAAQFLGMHGAAVIKVESPARPDGMRTLSLRPVDQEEWWEYGPLFHATNTNKLGLGLRLDRPRGLDLLVDLLDTSDVLIENFSPRVLDSWVLGPELLHQTNPGLILPDAGVRAVRSVEGSDRIRPDDGADVGDGVGDRLPGWVSAGPELYRTADPDDGLGGPLVAISVETDEQWAALFTALGRLDWAESAELADFPGRKAQEDLLDARLAAWCGEQTVAEIVRLLWASSAHPRSSSTTPASPATTGCSG